MIKIFVYSALIVITFFISLFFYVIASQNVHNLILCSDEETMIVPSKYLCKKYLLYFTDESDIQEFEKESTISYIFNGENTSENYEIADLFISLGADVNKISPQDGLTPIHSAILFNNLDLVRYLISKGASLEIKEEKYNLNALDFTKMLMEKSEVQYDWSKVHSEILKNIK